MRDFREYKVWQESQDIAVDIYVLTDTFDPSEKYGITSQLRRAAVSISTNIAEGCSRSSAKDFARFIEIAMGSTFEVESILLLCIRLEKLKEEEVRQNLEKLTILGKQLNSLRTKLRG